MNKTYVGQMLAVMTVVVVMAVCALNQLSSGVGMKEVGFESSSIDLAHRKLVTAVIHFVSQSLEAPIVGEPLWRTASTHIRTVCPPAWTILPISHLVSSTLDLLVLKV